MFCLLVWVCTTYVMQMQRPEEGIRFTRLELQVFVSWVLVIEPRLSARATSALTRVLLNDTL